MEEQRNVLDGVAKTNFDVLEMFKLVVFDTFDAFLTLEISDDRHQTIFCGVSEQRTKSQAANVSNFVSFVFMDCVFRFFTCHHKKHDP